MKICILTPRFPFPENGGDVLRINNIARYLKRRGHRLLLLSLFEEPSMIEKNDNEGLYDKVITIHHSKLKGVVGTLIALFFSRGPLQCGYYRSRKFKNALHNTIVNENPDLYISHLIRMTPYLIKESLVEKSIIEMTDALSVTYSLADKAKGLSIKKMVYRIEEGRIKKYEQFVINTFRKTVLVSLKDVDYFKKECCIGNDSLYCYKNGVDLTEHQKHTYDNDKICFVGNMRTLQNQDAILYYINNVFPALLKERPKTKLYIVGAQPSAVIQNLASDNIIVTGFVDSIYDVICDACYAIAPIQIAAGIQNKVLFAMAYHIPVIMTPLIARAIPEATHDNNCIIADNTEEYVRWGVLLSEDGNYRNRIADMGYQMVQQNYSWDSCLNGYEFLHS